jgi:hypothetical protein
MYGYDMTGDNTGAAESGVYSSLLKESDYLPSSWTGNSYGFKVADGIIELPFFADTTNIYAHRTQVYDSIGKLSTFYSIDSGSDSMADFNKLTGKFSTVARSDGNYRFAPEIPNGAAWLFQNPVYHSGTGLVSSDVFMVGNPYMSSLDMAAFLTDSYNAANIQRSFKIWGGSSGYISYSLNEDNTTFTSTNPDVNNGYVEPLQAFILQTRTDYTGQTNVAQFDVTKISKTRPAGNPFTLRSSVAEKNMLRIKAENSSATAYMLIAHRANASAAFNENGDVKKLFSPDKSAPEIYALAGEIPADIRFINNNGDVTVPLGIKTGKPGNITLTFTGMNNYSKASRIEFTDAQEKKTVDLTGKESYTCTLNLTGTGVQNGRFSLRFGKSMTALPEINTSGDLKVYSDSKGIYVISSASDPVQQVIIYDIQGRKLYESVSGERYYSLPDNAGHLPVIVKVVTKNQVKTVKL